MAVANGYGKTATSGSVFMYDVGDVVNSYKGKPTTNILGIISYSFGTQNDTYFKTNYGTELVNIPALGTVTSHYCNIYNDYYGGSGACCPSPFWFGSPAVSPSTTYTYQIIYRTTTGYANANYMYHYEYGPSGYLTEYGLWDSSRQESLGDGWYHAWGTFTSHASATSFATYLFHYEYGVWNKIQIAGVMLTQGNNIIPPKQFLNVNGTRSATQGLLPLIGNSTLDLSSVSFDSTAQITFDGTDDDIEIPFETILNDCTIELVFKATSTGLYQYPLAIRNNSVGSSYAFYMDMNDPDGSGFAQTMWTYWNSGGTPYSVIPKTGTFGDWNDSKWRHYVFTRSTTVAPYTLHYMNGNLVGNVSRAGDQTTQFGNGAGYKLYLGSINGASGFFKGNLPIVKIYNRVLSASEVRQNYNNYKTRFNLS